MADRDDWLSKHIISRPSPIGDLAERFEDAISNAKREEDMQAFFTENPFILSEQLPHGTHVVPKFRFGGEYVSDFLISEITSGGTFWIFVELEPVNVTLMTKGGQFSQRVREAYNKCEIGRVGWNATVTWLVGPRANMVSDSEISKEFGDGS